MKSASGDEAYQIALKIDTYKRNIAQKGIGIIYIIMNLT